MLEAASLTHFRLDHRIPRYWRVTFDHPDDLRRDLREAHATTTL
jgi:hypothetical protein